MKTSATGCNFHIFHCEVPDDALSSLDLHGLIPDDGHMIELRPTLCRPWQVVGRWRGPFMLTILTITRGVHESARICVFTQVHGAHGIWASGLLYVCCLRRPDNSSRLDRVDGLVHHHAMTLGQSGEGLIQNLEVAVAECTFKFHSALWVSITYHSCYSCIWDDLLGKFSNRGIFLCVAFSNRHSVYHSFKYASLCDCWFIIKHLCGWFHISRHPGWQGSAVNSTDLKWIYISYVILYLWKWLFGTHVIPRTA